MPVGRASGRPESCRRLDQEKVMSRHGSFDVRKKGTTKMPKKKWQDDNIMVIYISILQYNMINIM